MSKSEEEIYTQFILELNSIDNFHCLSLIGIYRPKKTYSLQDWMSLHTGFRISVIVTISDAAMKNVFFDLFFSASGRPESCVCTAWRGDHLLDLLADKSSINMLRGRLITGLSVSKLPTFLRNPAFVYKNAYLAIVWEVCILLVYYILCTCRTYGEIFKHKKTCITSIKEDIILTKFMIYFCWHNSAHLLFQQ